jgi:predicted nucleotide-binding protein
LTVDPFGATSCARAVMDSLLDDIEIQIRRCEGLEETFKNSPLGATTKRLLKAISEVSAAWSGSWIGYHANVYFRGFQSPPPSVIFDREWGSYHDQPGWIQVDSGDVKNEILRRAGAAQRDLDALEENAKKMRQTFSTARDELLATLEALLADGADASLQAIHVEIAQLAVYFDQSGLVSAIAPTSLWSRDNLAMSQGRQVPPHLALQTWIIEQVSTGTQTTQLAQLARRASLYLQKRFKMKGTSIAKTEGRIFIGHGRSKAWRDLKDFLHDRLGLDWSEFDRDSAAGLSVSERLTEMLDESCFAFLVMTAEDEHADGTHHARENVIHEAGLFQGRFGFRRAIVLLEEGCAEFSNIHGLVQIRFPAGNIKAASEDIRRVLEREKIIKP